MPESLLEALPYLLPLALLAGIAGGTVGFGIYFVIGPALWLFFSPTEAISISVTAGIVSSLILLFLLFKDIDWKRSCKIIIWALPGLFLGVLVHSIFPDSILEVTAALAIISLVLFRYFNQKGIEPPVSGIFAGSLSTSVGFNGPPISFSFHGKNERVQRGSTVFVLMTLSFLIVTFFLLSGQDKEEVKSGLEIGLWLSPLIALGVGIGHIIAGKINQSIEYVALFISVAGAATLFLKGIGVF